MDFPTITSAEEVNFNNLPQRFEIDFGGGRRIRFDKDSEDWDEAGARQNINAAVQELGVGFKVIPGKEVPGKTFIQNYQRMRTGDEDWKLPPVYASQAQSGLEMSLLTAPQAAVSMIPGIGPAAGFGIRTAMTPIAGWAANKIGQATGTNPEPYTAGEAAMLTGLSAASELPFIGGSRALRGGARRFGRFVFGATATPEEAAATKALYEATGRLQPSLPVLLEAARGQGMLGFTEKSLVGATVSKRAAIKAQQELLEAELAQTAGQTLEQSGEAFVNAAVRKSGAIKSHSDHLYDLYRAALPDNFAVKPEELASLRSLADEIANMDEIAFAYGGRKGQAAANRILRRLKPEEAEVAGPQYTVTTSSPLPPVKAKEEDLIPWEDLEYLKTQIGKGAARDPQAARFYGRLKDAMEEVLENNPNVSGDAVAKWRTASDYYRDVVIEENKKFYKPVIEFLDRPARGLKPLRRAVYEGDAKTVTRYMEMMTADEREKVQKTLIEEMMLNRGRTASRGLRAFARTYGGLSDDVKNAMFNLYPEQRRFLDALSEIANKEEMYGFTRSTAKSPLFTMGELRGLALMAGGAAVGMQAQNKLGGSDAVWALVGASLYPMSIFGLSRLLTNPKFAELLMTGTKAEWNGLAANIGRLPGLALASDNDTREAILEFLGNMGGISTGDGEQQLPSMQQQFGIFAGR